MQLSKVLLFGAEKLADSWLQALNDPVWTDARDHLRDDDPVLGLYLGRRAWALPWWVMTDAHVANLVLDDRPVLVTLCAICSSGSAFRREVEGQPLTFRLRGRYNGTMLLADTSTDSLWSPLTGVALAGTMRGAVLERLPLSQCLWSEWLGMHPTTMVPHADQARRHGRASRYFPGSPGVPPGMRATLVRPFDTRLPHNTLILGVRNGASARAYPLETLARIGPVLNDSIGGAAIVVMCRPGTLQALAFHRRVGDRILGFACSTAGVYDEETRSMWSEMGEAISGPLIGTQLEFLDSAVGEWYAFAAHHPDAEIFDPGRARAVP